MFKLSSIVSIIKVPTLTIFVENHLSSQSTVMWHAICQLYYYSLSNTVTLCFLNPQSIFIVCLHRFTPSGTLRAASLASAVKETWTDWQSNAVDRNLKVHLYSTNLDFAYPNRGEQTILLNYSFLTVWLQRMFHLKFIRNCVEPIIVILKWCCIGNKAFMMWLKYRHSALNQGV